MDVHSITELQNKKIPPTDDSCKYNYNAGDGIDDEYTFEMCEGKVIALRYNKEFVEEVTSGQECGVLLNNTCFYAEQGGQIYDLGYLTKKTDDAVEFFIKNVQVRGGYVIHVGNIEGTLKVGDTVVCNLDTSRRRLVMSNHTGTHVLNYALRKVLGTEADQRGSLVAPDRLRFDFTNKGPLSMKQVKDTETKSNQLIDNNGKVFAKETSLGVAKTINGLRAVFDETYPDPVRVVSIGVSVDELERDPFGPKATETSVEFCGGTHVLHAGHIGVFVIASEEAIAKGIRRIVGLTGPEATKALKRTELLEKHFNDVQANVDGDKDLIKMKENVREIVELIEEVSRALIPYWKKDEIRNSLKNLKKSLDDKDRAAKTALAGKILDEIKDCIAKSKDLPFIIKGIQMKANAKTLDPAIKQLRKLKHEKSSLYAIIDPDVNRINFVAIVVKDDVQKGLEAWKWISNVVDKRRGKGGGKSDFAQGWCDDDAIINELLNEFKQFAENVLV